MLGKPYLFVLDRFCRRRGGEPRRQGRECGVDRLVAREARIVEHIDEDRIEKPAIRRVIGARPASVAREQHMQRADAEIGRAGLACLFASDRECGKVADPLVATALVGAA